MAEEVLEDGSIPPNAASLGDLLLNIAPRIMRLEALWLSRLAEPLTHRQYRILQRVNQGVTSPTKISRAANISLAAISESVDALTRRGLIVRSSDESDRRASRLGLTPEGELAYVTAHQVLDRLATDISDGISPRRWGNAVRVLEAAFDNIREGLNRADSAASAKRGG